MCEWVCVQVYVFKVCVGWLCVCVLVHILCLIAIIPHSSEWIYASATDHHKILCMWLAGGGGGGGVCVCVYLPENEDLVPISYTQTVDAPRNVDVLGLGS